MTSVIGSTNNAIPIDKGDSSLVINNELNTSNARLPISSTTHMLRTISTGNSGAPAGTHQLVHQPTTVHHQHQATATLLPQSQPATATVPSHSQPTVTSADAGTGALAFDLATNLSSELSIIMNRTGGISEPVHVPRLARLLQLESRLGGRFTLLAVLQQSSQPCLHRLVSGGILSILESWVIEARDAQKSAAAIKIIECLAVLPVDLETLRKSSIGQTIGKLRKHDSSELKAAAGKLVERWKKVVDSTSVPAEAPAKALGIRLHALVNRMHGVEDLPASKRAKKGASPNTTTVAANAASGGPSVTPLGRGSGGGSAVAAVNPAPLLELMDMDLMLQPAEAPSLFSLPRKDPILTNTPAHADGLPVLQPDTHTATGSATAMDCSPSAPMVASSPQVPGQLSRGVATATPAPRPQQPGLLNRIGVSNVVSTLASNSSAPAAAGAAPSTAGNPSGITRLGSLRDNAVSLNGGVAGGTVVRLGSINNPQLSTTSIISGSRVTASTMFAQQAPATAPGGPQSASARAAAAAAKQASPERIEGPPKVKAKAVSWPTLGDSLLHFRLFRKDDPPSAARSNAKTAEEESFGGGFAANDSLLPLFGASSVIVKQEPSLLSQVLLNGGNGALSAMQREEALGSAVLSAPGMQQHQLPPGFESAARREHAAERQALAEAHEQEELEKKQIMERLHTMCASLSWERPPFVPLDTSWRLACGEDSTENKAQAERCSRTPRVHFADGAFPVSPKEPPQYESAPPGGYNAMPAPRLIPLHATVTPPPVAAPPPAIMLIPHALSPLSPHQAGMQSQLHAPPNQQQQQQLVMNMLQGQQLHQQLQLHQQPPVNNNTSADAAATAAAAAAAALQSALPDLMRNLPALVAAMQPTNRPNPNSNPNLIGNGPGNGLAAASLFQGGSTQDSKMQPPSGAPAPQAPPKPPQAPFINNHQNNHPPGTLPTGFQPMLLQQHPQQPQQQQQLPMPPPHLQPPSQSQLNQTLPIRPPPPPISSLPPGFPPHNPQGPNVRLPPPPPGPYQQQHLNQSTGSSNNGMHISDSGNGMLQHQHRPMPPMTVPPQQQRQFPPHLSQQQQQQHGSLPCKYHLSSNGCRKGDSCKFLHATAPGKHSDSGMRQQQQQQHMGGNGSLAWGGGGGPGAVRGSDGIRPARPPNQSAPPPQHRR